MNVSFEQKTDIGFQYVLDLIEPCSCFGAAALRSLNVFESSAELQKEFDNIEKTINIWKICEKEIKKIDYAFMQMKDIGQMISKCRETSLTDVELFEIKRFLLLNKDLYPCFNDLNASANYKEISFADLSPALDIVDPDKTGVVSFYISDTQSKDLAEARKEKKRIETLIRAETDKEKKERLLVDRTFIAAKEEEAEMAVKRRMSKEIVPYLDTMLSNIRNIAALDLLFRKAQLAMTRTSCRPVISDGIISFVKMSNPKINDMLSEKGKSFTPVSITTKRGATVITGANMGGKSVAIKTLALNVLLSLCGIYPFAEEATVSMLDNIFMITEDLESVDKGLSSFGGEIIKFNEISSRLTEKSLILLDEFARGTNPDEGAAIVRAVTIWLNGQRSISVLSTHYDKVAELADTHYQIIGLRNLDYDKVRQEVKNDPSKNGVDRIAEHMNFGLYKVTDKQDCPRDAMSICRLLDMNEDILSLAEKYY